MIQSKMMVLDNEKIADGVYRCVLLGSMTKDIKTPGQFINIKVEGHSLRRPISISDYDLERITIIYKTFGEGTEKLAKLKMGKEVDCLGILGNGFDIDNIGERKKIVLVGGGVGVPPLIGLAKRLIKNGYKVVSVIGFSSKNDVFGKEELERYGEVIVVTDNGSEGIKGNVLVALKDISFDYIYACGPTKMLQAIEEAYPDCDGQISLEERMACGIGVCMGCVCKTKDEKGYIRVCKEGPVVEKGKVIYE